MPGSIQSIERAAAVIRLLATGPGRLRLGEVAAALGMPKGTAHGILRTLVQVGFVDHDTHSGRYWLGATLLDLGSARLDANELRARSMSWADPLAARSGEAVRVAILDEAEVLVVHSVFRPDRSAQSTGLGDRLPAHATALGKVLLAFSALGGGLLDAELTAYTTRTLTDPARLAAELARIRVQGFGVDRGEHRAEAAGIAAPIHGYGGLVVAAVAVHGALDRLCDPSGAARPALVEQVCDCARSITRELAAARSAR